MTSPSSCARYSRRVFGQRIDHQAQFAVLPERQACDFVAPVRRSGGGVDCEGVKGVGEVDHPRLKSPEILNF